MRMQSTAWIAAVTVVGCVVGCAESLPPPERPEPTLPGGTTQPESGQPGVGRIAIATDVPARVERLAHAEGVRHVGVIATLLCRQTPCEVTLPYGDYEVRFTSLADPERTSQALLDVHGASAVLRHVLGRHQGSSAVGPVIIGLGAVTLIGGTIAAAALQSPPDNPSNGPSGAPPNGSNNPAPYIALAGLGVLGLGILITAFSPSTHQDGATTQWSPPALSGALSGGPFVLRF
jgi:hypothetical protein